MLNTNTHIMEKSVKKSAEQAEIIKSISLLITALDVDYCREAAKDMMDQATRQESLSVLNPNYPQIKNDILRTQGKALKHLSDYVSELIKVGELQQKLSDEEKIRNEISRLFI